MFPVLGRLSYMLELEQLILPVPIKFVRKFNNYCVYTNICLVIPRLHAMVVTACLLIGLWYDGSALTWQY